MDTNNTGAMNRQVFCTKCGKTINEGAAFCPFCGEPHGAMNTTVNNATQAQPAQLVQDVPGQGAPVTVNNYGYVPQEMTVGRWMLTMFLTGIPVVGIILLLVWALSSSPDNRSRKNWAIATFLWVIIGVVIAAIFGSAIFSFIATLIFSKR